MSTKGYTHTTFIQTFHQHSSIIWNIICLQEIHILITMEEYNLIIAGIIGSVITLFLTAIIDFLKEMYRANIEERKIVFQRKLEAAENAISWFQESIDCYRIMQISCNEISEEYNPVVWAKFVNSSSQANKLFLEASKKLNPLYLYFNMLDIENKYHLAASGERINQAITRICILDQKAVALLNSGLSDESEEIKNLQQEAINSFKNISHAIYSQIAAISEMIKTLRSKYHNYCR